MQINVGSLPSSERPALCAAMPWGGLRSGIYIGFCQSEVA